MDSEGMFAGVDAKKILQPTTLQEAINIIKFLKLTHREEIRILKADNVKQTNMIKKLERNRKKELEFLSQELNKYETDLAERTEAISKELLEKDKIIKEQEKIIEELTIKLEIQEETKLPEINISIGDSNSDSGIAMENEDSLIAEEAAKTNPKATRKYSRRFADSISFLRRVDFSPLKYKPNNRDDTKKKNEKEQQTLNVPIINKVHKTHHKKYEKPFSDGETDLAKGTKVSENIFRNSPGKIKNGLNCNFSDDGSEDTSEEIFDRVMTRNSIRRSVKTNPKYKKINRSKSKLLEQVKNNIAD